MGEEGTTGAEENDPLNTSRTKNVFVLHEVVKSNVKPCKYTC